MRYTEREFKYEFNSFYDFIRTSFILVFIAPARLVAELSLKIVYLNKKQIQLVLNTSFIIMAVMIVIVSVMSAIQGDFSLFLGKFPVVCQLASLVLMFLLVAWFAFSDIAAYSNLGKLIPILSNAKHAPKVESDAAPVEDSSGTSVESDATPTESSEEVESPSSESIDDILQSIDLTDFSQGIEEGLNAKDVMLDNTKKEESKDITPEDLDALLEGLDLEEDTPDKELINPSIYDNKDVIDYQNNNERIVADIDDKGFVGSNGLSEEEINTIERNLDDSTDPSKYLDEAVLGLFEGKVAIDNFGTIEAFSDWGVPEGFNMLA